ncbi:hypothetical protein, partial [Polymorphobacter multimanifer]
AARRNPPESRSSDLGISNQTHFYSRLQTSASIVFDGLGENSGKPRAVLAYKYAPAYCMPVR